MSKITKQLKLDQFDDIYILNKPENFNEIFKDLTYSESIVTTSCVESALIFVNTKDQFINQMLTLSPRLLDSSVVWVFYPNNTSTNEISKLYTEFDWDFLGDYRLKPTKLHAIDNIWNAMKIKKILI